MAKVGGLLVPITLNDGTEFEVGIEEGRDLYEGLKLIYEPPVFKPIKAESIQDPTANPQVAPQNEPG